MLITSPLSAEQENPQHGCRASPGSPKNGRRSLRGPECTHTCSHLCTIHTHTGMHTIVHPRAHPCTPTCLYAHIHSCSAPAPTCVPTHSLSHTQSRPHIHTHPLTHTRIKQAHRPVGKVTQQWGPPAGTSGSVLADVAASRSVTERRKSPSGGWPADHPGTTQTAQALHRGPF